MSEECWNLDLSFIEFIIPRLKMFKEEASKIIVYDFTIIDKILEGFELYRHIFDWDTSNVETVKDNLKKFKNLWTCLVSIGWNSDGEFLSLIYPARRIDFYEKRKNEKKR